MCSFCLCKPQGRPTTAWRKLRKQEIIAAALKLYTEKGYYQTNVRDIAREAGILPSAFYIYFPDKRELFSEVIDHVIADMTGGAQEALSSEQEELMKLLIKHGVEFDENYLWD